MLVVMAVAGVVKSAQYQLWDGAADNPVLPPHRLDPSGTRWREVVAKLRADIDSNCCPDHSRVGRYEVGSMLAPECGHSSRL